MKASSFANILLTFATTILVAHDSLLFATAEKVVSPAPHLIVSRSTTIDEQEEEHDHHIQDSTPPRMLKNKKKKNKKKNKNKNKKGPKVPKSSNSGKAMSSQPSTSNDPCAAIDTQRDALLALKEGLIGNNTTKLANWVNTSDPCTNGWYGVTCSNNGYVTEINFGSKGLGGTISPLIGCPPLVTSLTFLDFYENNLTGSIPTEIRSLTSLTHLDFSSNTLSGSIPTGIRSLTSLTFLDFFGNSLTGSIPTDIGSLTNLTYLDFGRNYLSGSIPTHLGSLYKLNSLYFEENNLEGSMPTEICDLVPTIKKGFKYDTNKVTPGCPPPELRY